MTATLTSKGQITIPIRIRKQLAMNAGDRVSFVLNNGHAELVPMPRSIESLQTILPKPKKSLTLAQLDAAIARGAVP